MQTTQWAARRQCLCIKCQNFVLILKALKIPLSPSEFIATYTTPEEVHNILEQAYKEDNILLQWTCVEVVCKGLVLKKVRLEKVTQTREEFITKADKQIREFREHAMRITTQHQEITRLRENLPQDHVNVQMDYSENFVCKYQDEVSQVYYDKCQVTLHLMVAYYKDSENNLKHKSYVCISDDTSHTAASTYAFLTPFISCLNNDLGGNLSMVHYVTDRTPSQYRNRTIAHLAANHADLFDGVSASSISSLATAKAHVMASAAQ